MKEYRRRAGINLRYVIVAASVAVVVMVWRNHHQLPPKPQPPQRAPESFQMTLQHLLQNLPRRVDFGNRLHLESFRIKEGATLGFTEVTADLVNDSTRTLSGGSFTIQLLSPSGEPAYTERTFPEELENPVPPEGKHTISFTIDNPPPFREIKVVGEKFIWMTASTPGK